MKTECVPNREDSLIHLRDCLFSIEDIKTALIVFVTGAKILFEVKYMALIISSGRKDLYLFIERSPHSKKGIILLKCQPLKKIEMLKRKWKTDFLIKSRIGNHRSTVGYLFAGYQDENRLTVPEDVLNWENLVALASTVFVNKIKPMS